MSQIFLVLSGKFTQQKTQTWQLWDECVQARMHATCPTLCRPTLVHSTSTSLNVSAPLFLLGSWRRRKFYKQRLQFPLWFLVKKLNMISVFIFSSYNHFHGSFHFICFTCKQYFTSFFCVFFFLFVFLSVCTGHRGVGMKVHYCQLHHSS